MQIVFHDLELSRANKGEPPIARSHWQNHDILSSSNAFWGQFYSFRLHTSMCWLSHFRIVLQMYILAYFTKFIKMEAIYCLRSFSIILLFQFWVRISLFLSFIKCLFYNQYCDIIFQPLIIKNRNSYGRNCFHQCSFSWLSSIVTYSLYNCSSLSKLKFKTGVSVLIDLGSK